MEGGGPRIPTSSSPCHVPENARDMRVITELGDAQVVELAQCGLAPSQRFTFYDHVHTTGMDIKQPPAGRAVLTMNKDTTLRDFAQGAYRMRGLGAGQRISVLMTPEVATLVHQCRKACRLASGRISVTLENFLSPSSPTSSPTRQQDADPVVYVLVWSTANGIRQECRKQRLLCQQNFRDVWKRKARLKLESVAVAAIDPNNKSAVDSLRAVSTQVALEDLRSRPEFFGLPARAELQNEKEAGLQEKLRMELSKRKLSPAERTEAEAVLADCWPPECEIDWFDEAPKGDAMEGEQVQEEEQEEEQEQEQEQEQEEEQEKEQEQEGLPEEPANEKFSRADERQQPWSLGSLGHLPSKSFTNSPAPPFYPLSDFAVHRGMMGGDCNFLDELPSFLMVSDNYYRKARGDESRISQTFPVSWPFPQAPHASQHCCASFLLENEEVYIVANNVLKPLLLFPCGTPLSLSGLASMEAGQQILTCSFTLFGAWQQLKLLSCQPAPLKRKCDLSLRPLEVVWSC